MNLHQIAERLDRVTWRGHDGFTARCPAHEDRDPSLSADLGDDGRVLLRCHAGCTTEAVVAAAGVTFADLFPEARDPGIQVARAHRPKVVDRYPYTDEEGEVLFEVERLSPKGFRQRRPDGRGGWVWKLGDVRRVLYRLPEVLDAVGAGEVVFVCEGEKDADALADLGYCATTMPGGTGGGWRDDYSDAFAGADVVVVADADEPGRRHAEKVRQSLEGVAKTVVVVEPAEGHKDVAEHLGAGYGITDFVPVDAANHNVVAEPARDIDIPGAATWPTLDPAALHGLAGEVVATIGPHTEADPVALLLDFLTCFGNAAGVRPHAIADQSKHPARLFTVLVGESAKARKGTSRANIRPLFEVADPAWSDTRVMGGLSTGEGLIATVSDPPPPTEDGPPPEPVDKRLLVVESEFSRPLAVAKRDGSTLSPILRDAWDTGRLRVMTRKDPLSATGAHISVLAHITVAELEAKLTATDQSNGFANRHLFACVARSKRLPDGGTLDPADLNDVARKVKAALTRARNIDKVTRTPAAGKLWAELYDRMAEDDPGGLVGSITARAEAQTLRLSVAYAIIDGSDVIDVQHLEAAWAVWSYCRASAAYIFGDSIGDEVADKLLAALRAAGPDGMTSTEQSALFGRHVSARQLEAARDLLGEMRLAVTTTEDTAGRPRVRTVAKGVQW